MNEDGQLESKEVVVQINAAPGAAGEDEAVADMCKQAIQDGREDLIATACPEDDINAHIRWDVPTSVCFRETTSHFNRRDPPETLYEVEIIDDSECCTADQIDACEITYEYNTASDQCNQT